MEDVKFNLEEAVNEYANAAIKKHFYDKKSKSKKSKGNLGTNQTNQLLTDMKEKEWDIVEIEGHGADRIITCKGRRDKTISRKELQQYNKCGNKNQMVYRTTLEELILMYLKYGIRRYNTTTNRRLAYEIGAITQEMYELSRLKNQEEKEDYYKALTEMKIFTGIEYSLLFDVANRETERIVKNIESILEDLSINNIIYYVPVTNGVVEGKNGMEEHEPLPPLLVGEIVIKQRQLREKYNVAFSDLRFRLKDERVKAYKKEEWEYLMTLGYTRIYNTNILELKAWDKEIEDYFQKRKELKEVFMLEHRDYAIDKAEKRNTDFFDKPAKVKNNKPLVALLGGREKKEFFKETETEYDKVFGTDLLEYDSMTQIKFSNAYGKYFGEVLKVLKEYQAEAE
ncbi:hypothetical protein AWH48_14750 [Domibacillus aminovorans]|uniref:Uncharacterized protein n=1 Tax=Domibacillus aminovorans TaxID=29332 RepID=A0A177L232_9BACI|nr:hypothetical protein [Domibacillus aminovorans]OAH59397.1 hypothetical protein AWH48_14750 [Domibacillus aminovorans]